MTPIWYRRWLIYKGKISTDFLDQKKENRNNNKRLHLKQDQMLVKVQTPIKEQHLALDKVLTLIKEQHLALDKVLTLIKDQHLAHQIVIKLLHKLLIFLKYLQMGERKNINSQGQKKVDQANNLLQPNSFNIIFLLLILISIKSLYANFFMLINFYFLDKYQLNFNFLYYKKNN